jgi:hypothetical protein
LRQAGKQRMRQILRIVWCTDCIKDRTVSKHGYGADADEWHVMWVMTARHWCGGADLQRRWHGVHAYNALAWCACLHVRRLSGMLAAANRSDSSYKDYLRAS